MEASTPAASNPCAAVTPQGYECCKQTAQAAAECLQIPADAVLVASTGVIGMQIPTEKIAEGVKKHRGISRQKTEHGTHIGVNHAGAFTHTAERHSLTSDFKRNGSAELYQYNTGQNDGGRRRGSDGSF